MKKNTHPIKTKSLVVLSNGSTFLKNWVFFKKIVKTDVDFLTNTLWKEKTSKL